MNRTRRRKRNEWLLSAPSLGWLTVFFLVPTLIIFIIALKPADPYGGLGAGWTLRTLADLGNPNYPAIVWRTVRLSVLTTAVCLALAIPSGYAIARAPECLRRWLLMLTVIPFWTSFLIRVFAWKVLLHPAGPVKRALVLAGLAPPDAILLYNEAAVLMAMIYAYLPFAILPVYAAAERFDFRLIEAARDLGAGRLRAFVSVFLPGIEKGLLTATLVVFVPALGSYVIPDVLGGSSSEMIGNKIAQRTFSDRNLPHASALSALLTVAVLAPVAVAALLQRRAGAARGDGGPA